MASHSQRLLIATTNAGKLGEIREVLLPLTTAGRPEGLPHGSHTPGQALAGQTSPISDEITGGQAPPISDEITGGQASPISDEARVAQAFRPSNPETRVEAFGPSEAETPVGQAFRPAKHEAAVAPGFSPAKLPITLLSLRDLPPIDEPEETGHTYAENARLKALYYAARSGLMTVAEDSGLMIDALDGEPGLLSARFAQGRFDLAFDEIFRRLEAKGVHESPARFICALALAHDSRILFESEGIVEGVVKPPPRGDGGFGYDPIFYYPPLGQTMAELPASEKHQVSHRGRAFAALREFLAKDPL